jgi:hypothetical protein
MRRVVHTLGISLCVCCLSFLHCDEHRRVVEEQFGMWIGVIAAGVRIGKGKKGVYTVD